jgi:hypothetical protein
MDFNYLLLKSIVDLFKSQENNIKKVMKIVQIIRVRLA